MELPYIDHVSREVSLVVMNILKAITIDNYNFTSFKLLYIASPKI